MLAGMSSSSFTLFTASTASPSDAFGARLKESVITGNWPWWLTVMGALVICRWVKALSGTWPPLGNAVEDADAAPNALLEAIVGLSALDCRRMALASGRRATPLCGPNVYVAAEPPDTSPVAVPRQLPCPCG